ncbi:hypothetical protein MIMGU_mgv1a016999mg [Erythranthe guttata]|uniref:Peptidase C1A papain C-terminal domain-containing protein n=1 Tax=Erythranthe guttata TaxID=4155 RepID=A0A022QBK6_ERYGU|nr:hypothetical protein MIMGU_mgv1a016999mg [Erythranthe guttata]
MEFYGATGTIGLLYAKHKGVSLNSDYPYVGGIQKNHQIPSGSHIVLIVGYGVDAQGYDYWIVQNTWGSDWGDKGFAKVRCGLVSIQSYADGVFLEDQP